MKKLLFIFLLVSHVCVGQRPFSPVTSGTSLYFAASFQFYQDEEVVNGYQNILLSASIKGSGTNSSNDYDSLYLREIYRPRFDLSYCPGPSWLGQNVYYNDQQFFLTTLQQDSMYFRTTVPSGTEWTFFRNADGFFKAKMESRVKETILGVEDSVISISLKYFNSQGEEIDHKFDGKTFRIAKTLGFIQTYNIAEFPKDTSVITLAGKSDPQIGIQNLSEREIYDFQANDEFHFQGHEWIDLPTQRNWYKSYYIREKLVNGDLVSYTVDIEYFHTYHSFSNVDTFYSQTTETWNFDFASLSVFDLNSFETDEVAGNLLITHLHSDTVVKTITGGHLPDENNYCLIPIIFGGGGPTNSHYKEGFGNHALSGQENEWLVFYRKNGKTWGEPLNFEVITSSQKAFETLIEVNPNPASDEIFIKNIGPGKTLSVYVYDGSGKINSEQKLHGTGAPTRLDISSLNKGIYLLRFVNADGSEKSYTIVKE